MLTMRGHLLAVTQIVDAFDTLAKGPPSRWFHAAFAAVSLSYTIWFLFRVTRPY
jgi:hypothetical protein